MVHFVVEGTTAWYTLRKEEVRFPIGGLNAVFS